MRVVRAWWSIYEWQIIGFLGITAFSFGIIGFFQYFRITGEERSFWDCVYLSMQLFVLESGAISGPVPWDLNLARFLAPFVSGYTAIQALSVVFREQIQILKMRFLNEHVIICGLGRKGLHIAREFRNLGYSVVALEKDDENPFLETCRHESIPVLTGNASDPELLKRANFQYAKFLVSLCGDDVANAEIAMTCSRMKNSRSGPFLTVIVHIVDPLLCNLIRKKAFMDATPKNTRLEFFNVFDSASRILLGRLPWNDYFAHCMVVGLGRFGESLIVQAARNWSSNPTCKNAPMNITILDRHANTKTEAMCARYPFLKQYCRFQSLTLDTRSAEYLQGQFLDPGTLSNPFSSIFVCFDNDSTGLETALLLQKWTQSSRIPIILRLSHDSGLAHLLEIPEEQKDGQLTPFGLMEAGCTIESVLGGTLEAMAKAVHQHYLVEASQEGAIAHTRVPWEKLSEEMKNSNRLQADHIGKKLKTIDCGIELFTETEKEPFQFTSSEIELLAEMEHRRFVEERTRRGWTYSPDSGNSKKKTSPFLIPYKDLTDEAKELNRNAVRSIPALLRLAGFRISRSTQTVAEQNARLPEQNQEERKL